MHSVVQLPSLSGSRTFLSPQKETSDPLAVIRHSTPITPPPGNHQSTLCLYGFAYSGFFLNKESYMWPFESGFFLLA